MPRLIAIILFFGISGSLTAQVELTVNLLIKDRFNKPMPHVTVVATEKNAGVEKRQTTDGSGKVQFVFTDGSLWIISYLEMEDAYRIEMPARGIGSRTRSLIYDPESITPKFKPGNREGISFKTIDQNGESIKPNRETSVARVTIRTQSKKPLQQAEVVLVHIKTKKKYLNTTDNFGVVQFLVPMGELYEIDVNGDEAVNWIQMENRGGSVAGVQFAYEPFTGTEVAVNDTILQELGKDVRPASNRVAIKVTLKDFSGKPLIEEKFFMRNHQTGKVFYGATDERGITSLLLPQGSWYSFSFENWVDVDSVNYTRQGGFGNAELDFQWMGSKAYGALMAARERKLRMRDSLYSHGYYGISILEQIQSVGMEKGVKYLNMRVDTIKASLKKSPNYFQESEMSVCAVFDRMGPKWEDKVIVNDLTGSMYPYIDEVLIWHALQLKVREKKQYFFFNDGDSKSDRDKKIGSTGGIYHTTNNVTTTVASTMITTMQGGNGGDGPENDIEALLRAQEFMTSGSELILVADNYSSIKDLELMSKLKVPVRIIVCGFDGVIHEDYIALAYATGGSIHTIEEDIMDIHKKVSGDKVILAGQEYTFKSGKFFRN